MERKLIAAAVSSALALPMAAQAVEFSVSGHVNRAIISVDGRGFNNDLAHVDSNASQSRVRFTGREDIGNGMTAGVNLEMGILTGQARDSHPPGSGLPAHTSNNNDTSTRHAAVSLYGAFGRLTLGHTSAAADGMAHARLGGPSWLGGVTNWCSYVSRDSSRNFISPACASNDGGRQEVLRYDTPAMGPATIAVSTGDNEYWDARLTVAGSFGDAGYDLRVGHIPKFNNDTDGDITTASAAIAFGQGISAAVAWSQERTRGNHEYTYAELDYSYGPGSVGVYWKGGEDISANRANREGSLWGVGVGHNMGGGATGYAGYRMMKRDGMQDVSIILAGMRVTFN